MDRKVFIKNFRTGYYVTLDGLIPDGRHYWNIRMTSYCDREKSAWFLNGSGDNGVKVYHKGIDEGQSVDVFLGKRVTLSDDPSSFEALGSEIFVYGKTNFTLINLYDFYYNLSITDNDLKYYMKAPMADKEKLIFVQDYVNLTNENSFIIDDFVNI